MNWRGINLFSILDEAKAAAWEMRREGKLRPIEVLDQAMQPVLDRQALRAYLDLQDRDWPETDGWV